MDISINIEDYKLNIRAAGLIIHNNKLLVHKNVNEDYYALLGGRVQIGEDSEKTIKREILEETGKEAQVTGYISTIENFFGNEKIKYHEILFVYAAEFVEEKDRLIEETIENVEGRKELHYEWIDLDNIDDYKLFPEVIKPILKENKFPVHKINNELE